MGRPHQAHYIHPFAAKIAPELVRGAILWFSREGELVLDPMAGSGTVALEAALLKRRSIATDLDPLAVLISRVKTLPLNGHTPEALLSLDSGRMEVRGPPRSELLDVRFWFDEATALDLRRISYGLERIEETKLKLLGIIAMSSMIVAKGTGSVANARDVAHSRPHRYKTPRETKPAVMEIWPRRVQKLAKILQSLDVDPRFIPLIALADARGLPVASESVDLIVTSPPYFNAIDYPRAHKFALAWLEHILSSLEVDYSKVSRELVGSVGARKGSTSGDGEPWVESSDTAKRTANGLSGRLRQAFERYVATSRTVLRSTAS